MVDYKITKCNVKLFLKANNEVIIIAEISRGYVYSKLREIRRDKRICIKIPYIYITPVM